jgi:hypothetical protein
LLVGKDKEEGIAEFILIEHPLQFLPCLRDTFPIVRVYDENDTLGVLEVCRKKRHYSVENASEYPNEELAMPPERADLVLPSYVPDGERNVLVFDRLDVKTLIERKHLNFVKVKPQNSLTYQLWG